jgi:hypothetical protein
VQFWEEGGGLKEGKEGWEQALAPYIVHSVNVGEAKGSLRLHRGLCLLRVNVLA